MNRPAYSKYISSAISALLGCFLMFSLLGVTLVAMTTLFGQLLASVLIGGTKQYLIQSILPTILLYAWLGYKTPTDNQKFQVFKFAWKFSVIINLIYWLTFLVLVILNGELWTGDIIISVCGFIIGTLIWPYTIGALVIHTIRIVDKLIYT